jgi:hypothetical protein
MSAAHRRTMSLHAQTPARPVSTAPAAGLNRLRRGSLAVLVLIVAEYGIGMYVNLYVTVPSADHDHSVGSVGPGCGPQQAAPEAQSGEARRAAAT